MSARRFTDGIGASVEIEGHLGEARRTGPHVLTHLLHLWRGLNKCGSRRDLLPVFLGEPARDALDRDEVLHHILLLVPSHHRPQQHRPPMVERPQLGHRHARGARRLARGLFVGPWGVLALASPEH